MVGKAGPRGELHNNEAKEQLHIQSSCDLAAQSGGYPDGKASRIRAQLSSWEGSRVHSQI